MNIINHQKINWTLGVSTIVQQVNFILLGWESLIDPSQKQNKLRFGQSQMDM